MGDLIAGVQKAYRLARSRDYSGLSDRLYGVLQRRLTPGGHGLPVRPWEIADSTQLTLATPRIPVPGGERLSIGWVTTPPGLGSGGHTTLLRMVAAAEEAGHHCTLFLYDRFAGDIVERAAVVREGWPALRVQILDATKGIVGMDVAVASSWQSAHALAIYGTEPQHRMYFIQDFEPYFYPRGSEYALAEDSYRFGFANIALGHMVAQCLKSEVGVQADYLAEFGCDTDVYSLVNQGQRSGVVCYVKPDVARRGYAVAELALEEFHRRHPEQEIHLYGHQVRNLKFPATFHSRLTPTELAALYNQSIAGIGMSFTNISLVVEEMLACGTIPVVNDSVMARADMPSPHVAWARPTPHAIADRLSAAVSSPDIGGQARAAAESIRDQQWLPGQRSVLAAIEQQAYGPVSNREV